MNKKEVQQRVLQNGKPLDLNKFTWDSKTKTFSTIENNLVIDFIYVSNCIFKTSSNCKFDTGSDCTFNTSYNCTFKTGSDCIFNTSSNCIFNTSYNCIFNTSYNCTFNTISDCIFNTSYNCTFKTDSNCTFNTTSDCIFNTSYNCTFNTISDCFIVRRDIFEVIQPNKNDKIQLFPYRKKGYLINGLYNNKPHIIADGIVSEIINKKKNVYKVKNLGQNKITYLIEYEGKYSHGDTLKQVKDDLIYKLSDRDTSKYDDYNLDTKLKKDDCIKMYMDITGACSSGTKYFVDSIKTKKQYTVKELIKLTNNQYGNDELVAFFK